ncbi:MAG: hypothetical protein R6V03_10125 [Kiritimatiellia bacterium]
MTEPYVFLFETAGLLLRLNFYDTQVLPCAAARSLSGTASARTRQPDFTLDIQPPPRVLSAHTANPCRAQPVEEYNGSADPSAGRGCVSLHASEPLDALANFLRWMLGRLIPARGGFILHAACLARGSGAMLFAGKSGAGKTTVCNLSGNWQTVNDDQTVIRRTDRGIFAWGMPDGASLRQAMLEPPSGGTGAEPGANPKPQYTIRAVFTLVKDRKNRLFPLSRSRAVASLLTVRADEAGAEALERTLVLLCDFLDNTPCYELHFRKDASFRQCIEKETGVLP